LIPSSALFERPNRDFERSVNVSLGFRSCPAFRCGDYGGAAHTVQALAGLSCLSRVKRHAEVAELEDALDSKSSGALPRAGSIPAFGI
jgi:hypothetical protein